MTGAANNELSEVGFPHRRCGRCEFYQVGQCHRNPPVVVAGMIGWTEGPTEVVWPLVQATDWCGEFRDVMTDHTAARR